MCDGCRSKCQCLLLLSDLPLGALPETGQTEAVEQKNGEKAVSLKLDVVCYFVQRGIVWCNPQIKTTF